MNKRRIAKWIIVVFLLAALPGLTAVMAQGQEPAGKAPLPAVMETGESAAPETYNVYESESNNTAATADVMNVGDVMGGKIGSVGDKDIFRFRSNAPVDYFHVLIDIEAQSIGSSLDPVVCLYYGGEGGLGYELGCNDDTDTADSLVFSASVASHIDYFVVVTDYDNNSGGNDHPYELILSSPLLISAHAANLGTGNVAGIPFQAPDILAWSDLNTGDEKWLMFFDASDVGITKNLWNVAAYDDGLGGLLIGFASNQYLPSIGGNATPFDMIEFIPEVYGPTTIGTFQVFRRGSATGLTTSGEKLDALDGYAEWGDTCLGYPVSTVGAAVVFTWQNALLRAADEDLFCTNEYLGGHPWNSFFDGSRVTGLATEDIIAMSAWAYTPNIYLTILGNGRILGHPVTQKDIFRINFPAYTWGGIAWHGPDHGWNYNIDAIEYPGQ